MATKLLGNKSHIGLKVQSAYGTAVATPDRFIELVGPETFSKTREKNFIPTGNTRSIVHEVNGMLGVQGSFPTFLTFNGDELLVLKHVMGSVSSSAANGDGQYTHTFSLAESLPEAFTVYANRNSANYGKEFQYEGWMPSKVTITQPIGQHATMAFEGQASGKVEEVTATSPTFPAIVIANWNHLISPGVLTLNGSAVPCDNLTFTLENTMTTAAVMSQNTLEDQKADGERIVTLSFDTFIVASDPVYALFTGDTEFAAVVTWKGAVIGGSSRYEFSISAPKCKITEHPGPQGGAGGFIKGTVTMRAKASTSLNDEVTITVKNADSAV